MLTALCLAIVGFQAAPILAQDEVMFARSYKMGEKVTYSTALGDTGHSLTADVVFTVQKVLPSGRAALHLQLENFHIKPEGTPVPPIGSDGLDVQTASHNLPDKFTLGNGPVNIVGLFAMAAACTLDTKVKAGASGDWTWTGADVEMKGTTKVVSVDVTAKRLKAEIKVTATHNGKDPLDMTLTSTFDLVDGSLVESTGKLSPAAGQGSPMDFSVKRKA